MSEVGRITFAMCNPDESDQPGVIHDERSAYEAGRLAGYRAGLEDAAKVCDIIGYKGKHDPRDSWANNCARAIRALGSSDAAGKGGE